MAQARTRGLGSVLAAAAACVAASAATAQSRDEDLFLRPDDLRIVPFASVDAGRSTFVSWGLKQALTGPLDREGYVAMETTGLGLTRERGDGPEGPKIVRYKYEASALGGYQFTFHGVFLAAFLGPEVTYEQVTVDGLIAHWSKPRIGARVQGEVWANPTPDTLLTSTLVAGSTRGSVWSRVSAGYRLLGPLFVGPEATVYATETYRELRLGAHVTGASLGLLHLRASAGWQMQEDERRASPYLGLAGYFRL
jgi:hypothetical protein